MGNNEVIAILIIIIIFGILYITAHFEQKREKAKAKELEEEFKKKYGNHITVAIKRYAFAPKQFVPAFYDKKKKKWMEINSFDGKIYVLRNPRIHY